MCGTPLPYKSNGLSNQGTPQTQLLGYLLLFSLQRRVPGFGGCEELVDLQEVSLLLRGERQRSLRIQGLLLQHKPVSKTQFDLVVNLPFLQEIQQRCLKNIVSILEIKRKNRGNAIHRRLGMYQGLLQRFRGANKSNLAIDKRCRVCGNPHNPSCWHSNPSPCGQASNGVGKRGSGLPPRLARLDNGME